MQVLINGGACSARTGFVSLTQYVGQSLMLLSPAVRTELTQIVRVKHVPLLILIIGMDLVGSVLVYTGMVYCGSRIFIVIYSSVVVFAALFRVACLSRSLSITQWIAIVVIFLGMSATLLDGAQVGTRVELGVWMTFFGTLAYAVMYVACEGAFSQAGFLSPSALCAISGCINSTIITVYCVTIVLPRRGELILKPFLTHGMHLEVASALYVVAICMRCLHYWCFYNVCANSSAVAASVNKSVQAVIVFGMSSLLFCSPDHPEQCFTQIRGIAAICVIGGALAYAYPTSSPKCSETYSATMNTASAALAEDLLE
eukprot:TRINITY_DN47321_c0_g1_i1.p1 TRINITY_DN47321_c0_g1~~TRINITY_DN47321_c0_g1_i1.p1  ORF type:complete len:314 (+),score=31.61 TRINITY_DN47321_c0_g1_i1:126-1067(+)